MATIEGFGRNVYSSARQEQRTEKAFQGIDQDQNGSISKTELAQAEEQMAARSLKNALTTATSVSARFASADTNNDNGLSKDEFAAMLAQAEAQSPTNGNGTSATGIQVSGAAAGAPAGPPPAGAAGPPRASSVSSASASDDSSATGEDASTSISSTWTSDVSAPLTTDPADANGDGVTTGAEQINYDVRHIHAQPSKTDATGANGVNLFA